MKYKRKGQPSTKGNDSNLLTATANLGRWCGLGGAGLLGQEKRVDVGQHTTLGDGVAGEEEVQLFIVADSQVDVSGNDTCPAVVAGGVASQLEDFGDEVLDHGSHVDTGL